MSASVGPGDCFLEFSFTPPINGEFVTAVVSSSAIAADLRVSIVRCRGAIFEIFVVVLGAWSCLLGLLNLSVIWILSGVLGLRLLAIWSKPCDSTVEQDGAE